MAWPEIAHLNPDRQRTCPTCGAPPQGRCFALRPPSPMERALGIDRPRTTSTHKARKGAP
jgi:hypothetical protein